MLENQIQNRKLVALQAWLEENEFSRSNFNVIKEFLQEGVDYIVTESGRYFIHEENIRNTILSLEGQWEFLLEEGC